MIVRDSIDVVTQDVTKDYKEISYTLEASDESDGEGEKEDNAIANNTNVIINERLRHKETGAV